MTIIAHISADMKAIYFNVLFLFCIMITGNAIQAQGIGGGLTFADDLGVSARFEFNATETIELAPSFTYLFATGNPWILAVDGHYDLSIGDSFDFYPIGGLHLLGGVADTQIGIDLGAGINLDLTDSMRLYVEANYLAIGLEDLTYSAGVLLPLGN